MVILAYIKRANCNHRFEHLINSVESVPLPTSTKGGGGGLSTTQSMTYSFYSTAEPVNVSARALSSTAAVVSWTLTKSISVIANNNNRTVISDIGDGGGGGADEVDQHQEQSSYSPVNNSIISPIRLEITYKPIQDRYKTGVQAHRRRRYNPHNIVAHFSFFSF